MKLNLKALDQTTAWIIGIITGVIVISLSIWIGKKAALKEETQKLELAKSAEAILEESRKHKKTEEAPQLVKKENTDFNPVFNTTFEGHFSYTGTTAPWRWSDLKPAWANCQKGKQQSPVDLISTKLDPKLKSIKFHYLHDVTKLSFSNQTVIADISAGSWIEYDGERFNLLRAFFRTPSEHRVQGLPYEMEIELQHVDSSGRDIFLSVLANGAKTSNELLKRFSQNLPRQEGEISTFERINWEELFPSKKTYWHYQGSYTYPPCHEKITWFVMTQPINVDKSSLSKFEHLQKNNARPIQKIGNRSILRSNR